MLAIALVVPAMRSEAPVDPAATPAPLSSTLRQVGADASWWRAVTADLARREYAATATPTGLQAPNRAQNLRTTFGERGIEVVPRTGKDVAPAWRFAWETSGFGRDARMEEVASVSPQSEGARVIYPRDGLSEWYENTAKGLEQGFTIERRPAGEGPLRIAGRVPATLEPRARANGSVDFIDSHGACAIRYGELHVWDAGGVELASKLVVAEAELSILVEDDGAAYPLTIDPLMTSPAWTAESDQAFAQFGFSVATAGDVNGDGFSDVIVGSFFFDNGQADEGRAFVYHGSAAGLSITPSWTVEGDQANAWFGYSVATAGDVNGDGFSDVIVGSIFFDNGQTDEGRAFVYHGSAGGLSATPSWTAESDQETALFGVSVATAGDVNGDGFSDVIVGSYVYDNGQTDEGRAFVYHGSAGGLSLAANWTAEGDQATACFGISVATAGDVNADGFSDVIVGASNLDHGQTDEGRAFVYHGSSGGLSLTPNWTAEGDQAGCFFGQTVAGAGDVNGDGFSDVIVGAHEYDNGQSDEGRAFVYHGTEGGLAATPAWMAESDQADAYFGISVATAGDVNGDGYSDVMVGASVFDNGQSDEGRVFVYNGSAAGLGTTAAWTAEPNLSNARFGSSVATAGDVNGDGFSDVIVGAPSFNGGQSEEGRAYVYHGSASGLSLTPNWTAESDQGGAEFGSSVATAGDVNGDGYSDVIVGAPNYDNVEGGEGRAFVYHGSASGLSLAPNWTAEGDQAFAEFGISVATAGDVNGDGFSDVIVGADLFDNGQTDEGRAFVYHGSASGLSLTPNWTAESDQEGAEFGSSVATAGDVNGDGYSDVIVGAPSYDNVEGRAFVYHGSASGLSLAPNWTGDQAFAEFGYSVATAGDVNGDGYSDVIVGAPTASRASVYHGSGEGLSTIAAWTVVSNQFDASFGFSVATAGDVNGDGYSDVIVGAPDYDDPFTDEGQAFVYHGSVSGLETTAVWAAGSRQFSANLGFSVATAGDVNGDGYSDVIVGAPDYDNVEGGEGRAFVYHGSAAGLVVAPAWTAESNQILASFGRSVSAAGDVNGDGFSDVIVGAPQFDNGQSNEGRAFVYYGNGGPSRRTLPRQQRTDGVTPIAPLGRSDSETGFRIRATMLSIYGRTRLQMEHEVKPLGTLFDGLGTVTGDYFDVGDDGEVEVDRLVTGLSTDAAYHWRVRAKYDPAKSPFQRNGPWVHGPINGWNEADLRTAEAPAGISGDGPWPIHFALSAPVPNPTHGRCEVLLVMGRAARIGTDVLDTSGRRIMVLVEDKTYDRGSHRLVWDGRTRSGVKVAAGTYFIRIRSEGQTLVCKAILMR